jgi:hypothetical protein
MVVGVFVVLLAADLAIDSFRTPIPPLGGFDVFLPWLVFPGAAAAIAVRSTSPLVVTGVATVLALLAMAVAFVRPPLDGAEVGVSLAAAEGALLGTWAGVLTMRRPGRSATVAGIMVAAGVGTVAAAAIFFPALATPPTF